MQFITTQDVQTGGSGVVQDAPASPRLHSPLEMLTEPRSGPPQTNVRLMMSGLIPEWSLLRIPAPKAIVCNRPKH